MMQAVQAEATQAAQVAPAAPLAAAGQPAVASRPPRVYKEEDQKQGCREFLAELRDLAKKEKMQDAKAIPSLALSARTKYLPLVGPFHFHKTLGDAFEKAKFASHRKSILYVLHELLLGMRKTKLAEQEEDFLPTCLNLLQRIGGRLETLDEKERETYTRIVEFWERKKVFSRKDDLVQVKRWWGVKVDQLPSHAAEQLRPSSETPHLPGYGQQTPHLPGYGQETPHLPG